MRVSSFSILSLVVIVFACSTAQADSVTGGLLLTPEDADQFAFWLGVGDQDFTNIWSGTAGVSTAASFHAAVDGAGPTFSIFGIKVNPD
jgi:hypothetical protein